MCGQLGLDGFITCENYYYGRHLGGLDYACRSERRRQDKLNDNSIRLVNKKDFTCDYAERGFIK